MIEMSDEEVEAAIRHMLAQKKNVDREFTRVFFDGQAPEYWGDWPEWARLLYDQWASIFKDVIRAGGGRIEKRPRKRREREVTLREAWDAIRESAREPNEKRFTWRDLADKLGVAPRAAEYQLKQKYGFKFGGRPGERELLRGPCAECGRERARASLSADGLCKPCRTERAAA